MKYLFMLLAACTLYHSPAAAQERIFRFGPKAGLNVSWLTRNIDNPRIGFHAGLLFHLKLHEHWRLQPEVYFSQQGGGNFIKVLGPATDCNYLAFPMLAQYRFKSRLYFEAGPQLGILVNRKLREHYYADGVSYVDHHENAADLLAAFGAGYQAGKRLGFNVRYNRGITPVAQRAAASHAKNHLLQTGMYMLF
ncbi:porin family protein [Chitinophaga alhagiae]|nr:porin family protein [Chitinophaga alhagiae]